MQVSINCALADVDHQITVAALVSGHRERLGCVLAPPVATVTTPGWATRATACPGLIDVTQERSQLQPRTSAVTAHLLLVGCTSRDLTSVCLVAQGGNQVARGRADRRTTSRGVTR